MCSCMHTDALVARYTDHLPTVLSQLQGRAAEDPTSRPGHQVVSSNAPSSSSLRSYTAAHYAVAAAGTLARTGRAANVDSAAGNRCLDILTAIMADVHPLSGLDIYADVCGAKRAASAAPILEGHPPLPGAFARAVMVVMPEATAERTGNGTDNTLTCGCAPREYPCQQGAAKLGGDIMHYDPIAWLGTHVDVRHTAR